MKSDNCIKAPDCPVYSDLPSIFLAGGITGCPDWQNKVSRWLHGHDVMVLNPRRDNFPLDDPSAAYDQIKWERTYLRNANVILFWFCAEAIQPIALFELGHWSSTHKPLSVGCDPCYPRANDVIIQLGLARPDFTIHHNLEDTVKEAVRLCGISNFTIR